jgi:hypothetical protein
MCVPGFTAEASLRRSTARWSPSPDDALRGQGVIVPAMRKELCVFLFGHNPFFLGALASCYAMCSTQTRNQACVDFCLEAICP